MYEWGKVKKVPGNKIAITIYSWTVCIVEWNQKMSYQNSWGFPWFPLILVEKVDDFGIRFGLSIRYGGRTSSTFTTYLLVATNQDVLLTEACYCLRLYGRLFLVNCYLLHVLLNYAQPASNVGGLVIHWTTVELAWQYIAVTRNNLCIIPISLWTTSWSKSHLLVLFLSNIEVRQW